MRAFISKHGNHGGLKLKTWKNALSALKDKLRHFKGTGGGEAKKLNILDLQFESSVKRTLHSARCQEPSSQKHFQQASNYPRLQPPHPATKYTSDLTAPSSAKFDGWNTKKIHENFILKC